MEGPHFMVTYKAVPCGSSYGEFEVLHPTTPGWRLLQTTVSEGRIYWTWVRQLRHVPGILKPPLGETDE